MKVRIIQPGKRFRKPPETGRDVIDVEPGNFQHGGDDYSTFGVSSGLVIAAHNGSSRLGLLGHFNSFPVGPGGLSDSIVYETAIDTLYALGPSDKTEIWLGGVSPSQIGELDLADENRQYAIDRLGLYLEYFELPETLVRTDWNPEGTYINAHLATNTGRLVIRQTFDLP